MKKYRLLAGLLFCLGCTKKEPVTITIVDIEHINRVGIAKALAIVNKYSPRVVGLDFLLTTDSLDKDIALSEELARTKNMIQVAALRNRYPQEDTKWGSLEQYHPKFRFGKQGFSNLTATDDSVIVAELPMRQYYREDIQFAFSYLVATQYDFNRVPLRYKVGDADFLFDSKAFGHHFKVISIKDLLSGNFDKKDLANQIVLLGATNDKEDPFYLDDQKSARISGVEIHACFIREILSE